MHIWHLCSKELERPTSSGTSQLTRSETLGSDLIERRWLRCLCPCVIEKSTGKTRQHTRTIMKVRTIYYHLGGLSTRGSRSWFHLVSPQLKALAEIQSRTHTYKKALAWLRHHEPQAEWSRYANPRKSIGHRCILRCIRGSDYTSRRIGPVLKN
jgi:hypothetical protein